jgi:protocadherin Fat 1/2/3
LKQEYVAEVYENEPRGTYVEHLEARSMSSLLFDIIDGNVNGVFDVNPSIGVIVTKYPLDYEEIQVYNLTVSATNMVRIDIAYLIVRSFMEYFLGFRVVFLFGHSSRFGSQR